MAFAAASPTQARTAAALKMAATVPKPQASRAVSRAPAQTRARPASAKAAPTRSASASPGEATAAVVVVISEPLLESTSASAIRERMSERFWLVKSEPGVFSIDDLAESKSSGWEGVRNFQARNSMRDGMKPGALVLFYHSNAKPSGIAGIAKVKGPPVPDPTQFDPTSEYFDATSPRDEPRWVMVNLAFVERFKEVLPLDALKTQKALTGMPLLQTGQRLSVQPVTAAQFNHVLKLAKAKTKAAS